MLVVMSGAAQSVPSFTFSAFTKHIYLKLQWNRGPLVVTWLLWGLIFDSLAQYLNYCVMSGLNLFCKSYQLLQLGVAMADYDLQPSFYPNEQVYAS